MAATAIAPQDVLGAYVSEGATAQLTTLTWTAIDIANTNSVTMTGRKVLFLFRNDDVATQTVTITSSENPWGRSANITTEDVAASAYAARMFEPPGWENALGSRQIILTASDADMYFAAINL